MLGVPAVLLMYFLDAGRAVGVYLVREGAERPPRLLVLHEMQRPRSSGKTCTAKTFDLANNEQVGQVRWEASLTREWCAVVEGRSVRVALDRRGGRAVVRDGLVSTGGTLARPTRSSIRRLGWLPAGSTGCPRGAPKTISVPACRWSSKTAPGDRSHRAAPSKKNPPGPARGSSWKCSSWGLWPTGPAAGTAHRRFLPVAGARTGIVASWSCFRRRRLATGSGALVCGGTRRSRGSGPTPSWGSNLRANRFALVDHGGRCLLVSAPVGSVVTFERQTGTP